MRFNHGYTTDDEKCIDNVYPVKLCSGPEYNVYDHLYETRLDSGLDLTKTPKNTEQLDQAKPSKLSHKEQGSGPLQTLPNHEYSHLTPGNILNKRQPTVPNRSFTVPSKCQWEIPRERLRLQKTIGRGEFGLVKKGFALNVDKNGGWVPVAVKTLSENGKLNYVCNPDILFLVNIFGYTLVAVTSGSLTKINSGQSLVT